MWACGTSYVTSYMYIIMCILSRMDNKKWKSGKKFLPQIYYYAGGVDHKGKVTELADWILCVPIYVDGVGHKGKVTELAD